MAKQKSEKPARGLSLANLPANPATRNAGEGGGIQQRKRRGRGPAGDGRYCGFGLNGQGSRSGRTKGPTFIGGGIPLFKSLPKLRGFKRTWAVTYQVINLTDLDKLPENTLVTPEILVELGLIHTTTEPVKLLGNGTLSRPVHLSVHAVSKSAREAVEKVGGSLTLLEWLTGGKPIERKKYGTAA